MGSGGSGRPGDDGAAAGAGAGAGAGALKLAWQPHPQDWLEVFQARHRAGRTGVKFALLAAALGCAALLGLGIGSMPLAGAGVAGALAVGVMFLLQPRLVRRFWNRTPAVRAATTAVVDPGAGITLANISGRSQLPWPSVGLVLETERVFVVHVAGSKAYFPLAKRGVAHARDLERLRALLLRQPLT